MTAAPQKEDKPGARVEAAEPPPVQALRPKPSREELDRILKAHRRWIESKLQKAPGRVEPDGKDKDGQQADLSRTDLRGVDLKGADLWEAQLQEADLEGAQLRGANLDWAELRGCYLSWAQLQGASLEEAQLWRAKLNGAQLQGIDLNGAQLQEALLDGAQLRGAYLRGAQLQGASLAGANFERHEVTENGEPGQQDLPGANLTGANFRDADLSNAQLTTATGLRSEKLAGAVLTDARLPPNIEKFKAPLAHVADTSQNARKTFFGLIAAALYSWLTIATTTDAELITDTVSSPLPIIGTEIPLAGFYLVAPLILLAVYFYFHLYLQRLWRGLSTLPARFPDGKALDEKAYPWLLNGLVRAHFKNLDPGERQLSRLENLLSILLAWWVIPLTLVAFWLFFLPRHDWIGTGLQVVLIAVTTGFGIYSYRLAVETLSGTVKPHEREEDEPPEQERDEPLWTWPWIWSNYCPDRWTSLILVLVLVALLLSVVAAIAPGHDAPALFFRTSANLREAELSIPPSDWTGDPDRVKGADLRDKDLRRADLSGAFLVKARLEGADLRGADLSRADLRSANLEGANLSDAKLREADLSGADLRQAVVGNAELDLACVSDGQPRLPKLPKAVTIRPCPKD